MTTAATDCWKTPERYVIIKRRNRAFNGKFLAVAVFPWTIRGITEERSWTTGIDVRLVNYKLWTLAWQARPCFQLTRYRTSGPYQVGSRQRENLLPPHRGQESVYTAYCGMSITRERQFRDTVVPKTWPGVGRSGYLPVQAFIIASGIHHHRRHHHCIKTGWQNATEHSGFIG